jgi:hypothetical protein
LRGSCESFANVDASVGAGDAWPETRAARVSSATKATMNVIVDPASALRSVRLFMKRIYLLYSKPRATSRECYLNNAT